MPFVLLVFVMLLPMVVQADPIEQGVKPTAAMVVKGDILYVEGEYLVVKEISGRETRVHVNGETKIVGVAGKLKSGDKIEATITPEGHASSVALQVLDSASPPSSR
jgi:hypothetical protein